MNQPELGNYIAHLRKEQGLTQEELVEKCNINVRTIQRIEAGDVTPRSYTVKNILEALGKSIDEVFQKVKKQPKTPAINYNTSLLGWGIIAGIFYLILGTFNSCLSLTASFNTGVISTGAFMVSTLLEFILATLFLTALAHFGKSNKNALIKNASYGAIAFLIFFHIIDNLFYSDIMDGDGGLGLVLGFSSLFLYGLMYFSLAVGFFIKRKELGELAKWSGITGMVGGLSFCLIILFPVGILATLAFEVMLIILLYRAWDDSNKEFMNTKIDS
jgi:transcriptional regulator with XRE-family HTH domain